MSRFHKSFPFKFNYIKEPPTTTPVVVGTPIKYTVIVINTGNWLITNLTVFDTFGNTLILGNLSAEHSITGYVYHAVTLNDIQLTTIHSGITVIGQSTIGSVEAIASTVVNLGTSPTVILEAYYGSVISHPIVGTPVIYTYTVHNVGQYQLTNVVIDDTLGIHLDLGTMSIGETKTVTDQYPLTQDLITAGMITSQATVTGHFETLTTSSTLSTVVHINQISQLLLTKEVSSVDNYVGGTIEYILTLTNVGNLILHGMTLTDPMLHIDDTIGQMDPSYHVQVTGAYQITSPDVQHGSVTNTATAQGLDSNQLLVSTLTTINTPVPVPRPSIHLGLEVLSVGPMTRGASQGASQTIKYQINVTNNGNVLLQQIHLIDPLLGFDHIYGQLPIGQHLTVDLSYQVTGDDSMVTNQAEVSAWTPSQQEVSNQVTLTTPLDVSKSSIYLSKLVLFADDVINGTVLYQLTVINNGNQILHQVHLIDTKLGIDQTMPINYHHKCRIHFS